MLILFIHEENEEDEKILAQTSYLGHYLKDQNTRRNSFHLWNEKKRAKNKLHEFRLDLSKIQIQSYYYYLL